MGRLSFAFRPTNLVSHAFVQADPILIGWGNLSLTDGTLRAEFGYTAGRPTRDRAFRRALEDELAGVAVFPGRERKSILSA